LRLPGIWPDFQAWTRFRSLAPEALGRARVDDLRRPVRKRGSHLIERGDEALVEARREDPRLGVRVPGLQRTAFADPFRQPPCKDADVFDATGAQGPPDPRRGKETQRVIDHKAHAIAQAQRGHSLRQRLGLRQHVRQSGIAIRDRVDVEKDRAGDMPFAKFCCSIAARRRQVPRRVAHAEIGVAELGGKLLGGAEIAS
jgi:hypothetical protein